MPSQQLVQVLYRRAVRLASRWLSVCGQQGIYKEHEWGEGRRPEPKSMDRATSQRHRSVSVISAFM